MFKNLKLRTKMMMAFGAVALITLLLGLVGYYGAVKSAGAIQEIGAVRLPGVDHLLTIKESAENIRGTLRTLVIPGLEKAVRERQYNNLTQARETYQAAWSAFEKLPRTQAETDIWQQFVPAWGAWREENNKFMEMSRQFDRIGIADPTDLTRRLEQFTKDHYILVHRVRDLLANARARFDGGEDHPPATLAAISPPSGPTTRPCPQISGNSPPPTACSTRPWAASNDWWPTARPARPRRSITTP